MPYRRDNVSDGEVEMVEYSTGAVAIYLCTREGKDLLNHITVKYRKRMTKYVINFAMFHAKGHWLLMFVYCSRFMAIKQNTEPPMKPSMTLLDVLTMMLVKQVASMTEDF